MSCKFALVLCAFGTVLAAQPTLEGTVTDALRHSGIAGVQVRLTSPNHEEHETSTDEAGRFSFDNLPVDAYTVILRKEGYIPADGSDEMPGRLPVVRPGTERVSLEMLALSELRGRVLHSDGTPAEGVELLLDRANFTQRTTLSGVDGAFVFPDLRPGSYYVLARPKTASPGKDSAREAATYYPEALDLSQAQEVIIGSSGTVSGIDIHLRNNTLYQLNGVVVNNSGERVKATVELRRKVSSGSAAWLLLSRGTFAAGGGETISIYAPPDSTEPYASTAGDDGRFSFFVPAGEWVIHARAEISDNRQMVGDLTVVVPAEQQESLQIPLEDTFDLRGIAEAEGERNGQWFVPGPILRPVEAELPLVSAFGGTALNLSAGADLGGERQKPILFTNVRAGSYTVQPSAAALMTGLYLVGFSVGGQNAMGRTFYLSATATDLRAVFRRAKGGLQGRTEKGEPATVLIIPESDSPTGIICIDSPKERPFSVPPLAPGNYIVVAVDKMDPLRFADRSVRAALLTLGTRIKIDDTILNLTIPVHRWPE